MTNGQPYRASDTEPVLVTGASGYLGGHVARALALRGDRVRTLQRRSSGLAGVLDVQGALDDQAARAAALDGAKAVVHLAAKVSFAGDPAEFVRVNVDGTRDLLADARAAGVSRFLFVSSPSVAHAGRAIMGDGAEPADPVHARGDYARTKAAAELLALAADAPGFAVTAVRPHIVWGPGDPQLTERIQDRARRGRVPLIGSGAALVDSTYIDDAVSGILAALDRTPAVHGRAYVLTSGEPRPISELFAGIAAAAGAPAPTRSVPAPLARLAGALVEAAWRVRPGEDEPPMTRFLAEQLSTAHWFDQRRTHDDLRWRPAVGVTRGLALLAQDAGNHSGADGGGRLRDLAE
ncbi:NAD-dependent epimerase/dehydratase family protein [uncultured Amnibacterium sp.]|uniref:NAD-dependent epimerase/dehydratase family protein n=1 Tax=uncultured Amnibacterium sp. TaxID=1631851 RepID=UPI0035C9AFC1